MTLGRTSALSQRSRFCFGVFPLCMEARATVVPRLGEYCHTSRVKLMHSLNWLCLSAVKRRRSDGFQSRCLRCVLGISPAFASKAFNPEVCRRACCHAATGLPLQGSAPSIWGVERHADVLGTIQCMPSPSSPDAFARRPGGPRREWITKKKKKVFSFVGRTM